MFAFALAAAAKIDAQCNIAPLRQLFRDDNLPAPLFVAAEAVQYDKCRSALARAEIVRRMHDTG
jgi:hypothetical protein